jgi:ABC-2 type transport system ATP-binding protein/lipopolysaccharide transport system ATP-binding protein
LRRTIRYSDFWALREVDLVVDRGEALGIVGHNGAGKSTLLKVIGALIRPRAGRVRVRGRAAPLLELGTGFDLELTGRENVFLNAMMLGFTRRDIAGRFERIVEFAGVGEFIDAPLRTYSTGMVARLGFAIATDVDPEILLVDEILGAGDREFLIRSAERIAAFHKRGGTMVLVSHNLAAVRDMCRRTLWLDRGRVKRIGPTDEVLAEYAP